MEVAGAAVMQVRYSLGYSVLFVVSGLLSVGVGIIMYSLSPPSLLVPGMLEVAGVSHLAIAAFCWRRVYFEVFENRIEFLSPVLPRWRRAKPLESIVARSFHRLFAKGEDFKRFVAWRDGYFR